MKIGKVKLKNPVIAAPLAGVTDKAYRILAAEFGCSLVFSEMISAAALHYGNKRTYDMLDFEREGPIAVQIFGSDPVFMAEAAKIIEKAGADIIDINMGCPTPKIVNNGDGAALMRDPVKAGKIVAAVVGTVNCTVTVKMRKGWDEEHVNAVELAEIVTEAGAEAVIVHGRTRSQFYSGKADWDIIGHVAEAVKVPVIGNGDIWQPQDARNMLQFTGCKAVMLARGALGNPWLFLRTKHYLETGELLEQPTPEERIFMALRHFELLKNFKGESRAVKEMRKHFTWYLKGLRDAGKVRNEIMQKSSMQEVELLLKDYLVNYTNSEGMGTDR